MPGHLPRQLIVRGQQSASTGDRPFPAVERGSSRRDLGNPRHSHSMYKDLEESESPNMTFKKLTLWYLASYLFLGGMGLAFFPDLAFRLLLSNGDYGDVMPRLVGMFMLALSALIASITRNEDYKYYPATLIARTFIVLFLTVLYFRTADPMFLVLIGIVLLGLIPACVLHFRGSR